jgi:hypothetical protein
MASQLRNQANTEMSADIPKKPNGGRSMKQIWSVILLVSMLALAGCPDMVQQGGGESSQPSRSSGGGD